MSSWMSLLLKQNDHDSEERSDCIVFGFGPSAVDCPTKRICHAKIEPSPLPHNHRNGHQHQVKRNPEPIPDSSYFTDVEIAVSANEFVETLLGTWSKMCQVIKEIVRTSFVALNPKGGHEHSRPVWGLYKDRSTRLQNPVYLGPQSYRVLKMFHHMSEHNQIEHIIIIG